MIALSKISWLWWIVIVVFAVFVLWSLISFFYVKTLENPRYTVEKYIDDIEIRQYEPMIVAQVSEKKPGQEGLNSGFSALADYIFGNNTAGSGISMTTPVIDTKNKSESISMTTPVIDIKNNEDRTIVFTMPSKWTIESIPKPNNPNVELVQWPAEKKAVLSFFLFQFENQSTRKNAENNLLEILKKNNISHKGDITFAFYNPPFTPFFLRRNEVMVTVN